MDLYEQSKISKRAGEGIVRSLRSAELMSRHAIGNLLLAITLFCSAGCLDASVTRVYNFTVQPLSVTRLCKTKSLVAVNGMFPGPTLYANEGDRVIVNVTNTAEYNITIHWHGIRQLLSAWSDGPVYVTQCPMQTGQSFVYNFTLTKQRGTLLWHAHATWLRGTVYGAIVIFPEYGTPYPFKAPDEEHVIILGEWWYANVEEVETTALLSGGPPAIANAYTINGLPGPLYNCSYTDTYVLKVAAKKTYLLRVINAGLNTDLFFSVSNHKLTVVEIDGDYTKPYTTDKIVLTPGQTTNVLLSTDQLAASYYMWASPYISAQNVSFQKIQTLALLEYEGFTTSAAVLSSAFPAANDTNSVTTFSTSLRSLDNSVYPEDVPQTVDRSLLITVGLGIKPCDENHICQGPNRTKFTASMNNFTLVLPDVAVLQAYFFNIAGVFTRDFPDNPLFPFNYTGNPPANQTPGRGTKATVLPFNSNVQIVFQDTSIQGIESHPIHLHGFSFYIVGQGFGNFNSSSPASFNLVDPPKRNTIGVPVGGWAAIRFKADNPGIWLVHCHLEIHTSWGLSALFLVPDGVGPSQSLPPPPADLPQC
ncbi:hypothetical protein O6H91_02G074900 [Diphasiastrum complanatum]|uniref:Uncharacterized protein n=1 Tax=Diphasiastrum complanatum TaxID=34168 RepID=A0ACC2EGU5_DIPCM|nr:hypothetical protein O6H91_02G074900 [Diphasiastrum complanatum]